MDWFKSHYREDRQDHFRIGNYILKRVKAATFPVLTGLTLAQETAEPLYQQLYGVVREAILAGEIEAGMRLPSTRILADELSVSRNTIVNAFDQLIAEGYLESRTGDGTYVAHTLPDELLRASATHKAARLPDQPLDLRGLSARGAMLARTPVGVPLALDQ